MVSLWDLDEMMCLHTYGGMASQIRSLSFSADGAHLAVGAEDEHVDIVAVASSTRVHAIAAERGVASALDQRQRHAADDGRLRSRRGLR